MPLRRNLTPSSAADGDSSSPQISEREKEIRQELHDIKREEILVQAADFFYEHGYHETKLDDIAQKLRVGKPHIYNYVKSKAELLSAVASRGTNQVYAVVTEEFARGGSPEEMLRRITLAFTRCALVNHKNVLIYFRENMNLPKQVRDELNRERHEIDRIIKQIIDDGVKAGQFDETDSYINSLTVAGMMSYTFAWYNPKSKLSIDYICEEIARQVIRMLKKR